ncbi:VWA domain-containing protein [Roseivivax marinus]|uniref:vWA domain-containing protein n=1 Tax=Roseivivax marinus TaxID=1379903 RepID=UPI001F034549|nr:VWA domain-containing protein [Roseivivax marinus]UMA64701.1 VWA domain-containing protein [Roseivivax marinus]
MPDPTLLRPLWLLALPLVVLAAWLLSRRGAALGDWGRAVDPGLLEAMRALGRVEGAGRRGAGLVPLAVAALVVLALTGPALERRDRAAWRNLDGVIYVLDASPSVAQSPRWPQLQTMGRFAISAMGSRPGGMVVYAGDAYVATDMTADLRELGQTLSVIDAETVPDPGSRPERGLSLARRMLEEARVLSADVVLMTDGGGLGAEALREAEALASGGARLSVVGLDGTTPEMESLAGVGGGRVWTTDQTDALAAYIRDAGRDVLERQDYPLLFLADYGRLLLALALLPALQLFRRAAR